MRRIAHEIGLHNAAKKDSTGICFIGERPFREFLNRYLPTEPGPILTPEGQKVGRHEGLSFYTLGQRKGLGVGGVKGKQREDGTADAWYVARKDLERNRLYVVQGHDHPWLLSNRLQAQDASWVAGRPPERARLWRQDPLPPGRRGLPAGGCRRRPLRWCFRKRNGPSRRASPPCCMTAISAWAGYHCLLTVGPQRPARRAA